MFPSIHLGVLLKLIGGTKPGGGSEIFGSAAVQLKCGFVLDSHKNVIFGFNSTHIHDAGQTQPAFFFGWS